MLSPAKLVANYGAHENFLHLTTILAQTQISDFEPSSGSHIFVRLSIRQSDLAMIEFPTINVDELLNLGVIGFDHHVQLHLFLPPGSWPNFYLILYHIFIIISSYVYTLFYFLYKKQQKQFCCFFLYLYIFLVHSVHSIIHFMIVSAST